MAHDDPGIEDGVPTFAALPVRLGAPSSGSRGRPRRPAASPARGFELGSQPLWPFRTFADAEAWRAAAAEGHQPWHADAAGTAALFTTSFLGFTEIDEITSTDVRADEAWIGVGYREEAGRPPVTSAVVHLVRFGPHADSPWRWSAPATPASRWTPPATGPASRHRPRSAARSRAWTSAWSCRCASRRRGPARRGPVRAGGRRGLPWQTTVAWSGASDPALTVVVWTGGHVQDVERFAVTGVPG